MARFRKATLVIPMSLALVGAALAGGTAAAAQPTGPNPNACNHATAKAKPGKMRPAPSATNCGSPTPEIPPQGQ
jgi:hypothetical protein